MTQKEYTLYSFTVIRSSSEAFQNKVPYLCGLIEDSSGTRKVAYLGAYEAGMPIEIGAKVSYNHREENGLDVYRID